MPAGHQVLKREAHATKRRFAMLLVLCIFGIDPATVSMPDCISEWDIYQIKEAVKKAVFDTPEIPAEYQTTSEGVTKQEN